MSFLNSHQKNTLSRVCDTLLPALEAQDGEDERLFGIRGSDLNLAELVEEKFEAVADAAKWGQIKLFLNLLENPLLNFLLSGHWGLFSRMDLEKRTAVLQSWGNSRFLSRRQAFQSIKRLTIFLFYAVMPNGKANPTWPVFNYDGPPLNPANIPRRIKPLSIEHPATIETDVLVIGSGAGGSVVAAELSQAGFDVVVLEKGGYYAEKDFTGQELAGYNTLYENEGTLSTADLGMSVLAGTALGGGTVVNWMTSLMPPDFVLQEWAADYGFEAAVSPALQTSLAAVRARLNVNSYESSANRQNALLAEGAEDRGCQVDVIPRNVKDCVDCTYCNYGCIYGAKQSTLKTHLQDAYENEARLIVRAHADRILHENGRVTGAEVTVNHKGKTHRLTVKANLVVAAAGAIHTPALFLRSGLKNKHIGQNLYLHPVTQTWALYDQPVYSWQGAPQTRVVHDYSNLDGRGYGVWLETAPGHPGTYTAWLPWQSGRQHKRLVQQLHHLGNHIVLTRDKYGGRIRLDPNGQPILDYRLHKYDAKHLGQGMAESFRIHREAGATEIIAPHNQLLSYKRGEDFETFLTKLKKLGFPSNGVGLFSAHQMSTCRIAASPALGAVKPTGETYEIANLYVADASVFPTAVGVNPMLTIMGIAHLIAQEIKDRGGKS